MVRTGDDSGRRDRNSQVKGESMADITRVRESETSPKDRQRGVEAARIVMGSTARGLCVHLEVLPVDRDAYLTSGDYDLSMAEAETIFAERVARL
jgi:hypothetical protein